MGKVSNERGTAAVERSGESVVDAGGTQFKSRLGYFFDDCLSLRVSEAVLTISRKIDNVSLSAISKAVLNISRQKEKVDLG